MDRTTVEHPKRDRLLDPTRTAVLVVDVQMDEISDERRAKQPYWH